jgi:type VII secretion-associated serine protease mycosin
VRRNLDKLRVVVAGALAVLAVLVAAQPAAAATRRERQWYLDYLRIDEVHEISTGQGVLVAVIDSGVDASHPDLRGQVVPGLRSDGGSGDGRADEDGHGTHMAGIIAARNAGRDGVLGVAPGAKILPIKTMEGSGEPSRAAVVAGIRAAADRGAKVINISIAGIGSGEEIEAINYALSKDAVVVAGAGNTSRGHQSVMSPANIPGVIAVTGLDQRGSFWSGSAQGPEAVVAAPAEEILNADIPSMSRYSIGDGTSDASAIVSGVAALIRARYPDLDAANVINRIIRTADDAGPAGRDPQYGFGRINPLRALTASVPEVEKNPLLDGAALPPVEESDSDDDKAFDVTEYGNRSGPTDQQVLVIGIAIAGVLLVLLVVAVVLLVRWLRRRPSPPRPSAPVGPHPPVGPPPPAGYGGPPAGPPPPAGFGPPAGPPR